MITEEFWQRLSGLRACSRLILVALEERDHDALEHLSRESEETLAVLRPVIEERRAHPDSNEDDERLVEMLEDLKLLNDRIVEELALGREHVRQELGDVRESRLRLVQYRDTVIDREPALVDRDT